MAYGLPRRSIAAWLGLFACFAACTGLEPTPAPPPARCPGFSGTYWYPGYENQSEVCAVLTKVGYGVGLPMPSTSGWLRIMTPAQVQIEQDNCAQLEVYAPFGTHRHKDDYDRVLENFRRLGGRYQVVDDLAYDYSPDYFRVDRWIHLGIDLVPGRHREVRWSDDSLYLRYRFRARGFGAGWSRHYLTLRLRKLPGGALRYELRHDEIPGGDNEIVCTLPPAPEGADGPVEPPEEGSSSSTR